MRYRHKTKITPRKPVLIVLSVLIVVGIASFFVARIPKAGPLLDSPAPKDVGQPTKSIDYNQPTPEQTEAGEAVKELAKGSIQGSDSTPTPPPASGSSKSQVGMEVTTANIESGTLHLRTLIQAISSTGTCTLVATGPNNKTHTSTASVQAGPSTSTCQGFNIPLSSLSVGTWKFLISFENEALKASASTEKTL